MICETIEIEFNVNRLQQQLRRLRDRLADAWEYRRPKSTIYRIEALMKRRWSLLEEAQRHHRPAQPA